MSTSSSPPGLRGVASRVREGVAKSPFMASMAVLFTGSAASAVVGFVATPLLSRIYSPAEFGVLGVFVAALSIMSVLATLRYDRAIPATADDGEAASILLLALATVVITSCVCCILVLTGTLGSIITAIRGHEVLLGWALPVGMAASGAYDALSFWMIRRNDFRVLSVTKVSQSVSAVGSQIGLGILRLGGMGLVVGQIAGSSMGIARLARRIHALDAPAFTEVGWPRITKAAGTYRRFPLLSAPAVLLDALTGALPTLVMAHRFGAEAAGVLTIVTRVMLAPLALASTSLGQIFFGELAELHRNRSPLLLHLFFRRLRQFAFFGFVLVMGMVIVVPLLVPLILGARWDAASRYFLILSPMVFAGFIASPFSFTVDVLRRQDLHLMRDFLRVSVLVLGLLLADHASFSAPETLMVISGAGCINGLIYLGISCYSLLAEGRRISGEVGGPDTA